jgi:hypothetical protein
MACSATVFGKDCTLYPPDFDAVLPVDAVVTGFSIKAQCVGVGAVKNVPDGWSFHAEADGEDYVVRITRSNAEKWLEKLGAHEVAASNEAIGAIRLDVIFRGQWSDCASARAVIHLKTRQASGGWEDSDIWLHGSLFDRDWTPDPYPVHFES